MLQQFDGWLAGPFSSAALNGWACIFSVLKAESL